MYLASACAMHSTVAKRDTAQPRYHSFFWPGNPILRPVVVELTLCGRPHSKTQLPSSYQVCSTNCFYDSYHAKTVLPLSLQECTWQPKRARMLSTTTKLCRYGAPCTSGLRTCHALQKGMLPGHCREGRFKGSNDRRGSGEAGAGSDRHEVATSHGQTQGARHGQASRADGRAQVEGGTETAPKSAKTAAAGTLLHCQPMNGCTWSAPCVSSRRRTSTT
jgi:hypothetical protein